MYCESCGTFIPDGQAFCSNCGAPVAAVQSAPQPAAQPVAQAAPAPAPQPVAQPVAAPAPQPVPVQPVYQQPAYQQPSYQQPSYQQPASQQQVQPVQPAYQQPVYTQPVTVAPVAAAPAKRSNGAATAGLVFGILTLVFCLIPFLFWGFALFGLIFSIIGVAKRNVSGKGKAIAGLILTVVGLIIGIIVQEFFWTEVGKEFNRQWDEAMATLYDTSYPDNDNSIIFSDGEFTTPDQGYVTGVLHIDGYLVEF